MTAIVGMALGHRPIPNQPPAAAHTANFLLNASGSPSVSPVPSEGNACEEPPEGSFPGLNRSDTDLGHHCICTKLWENQSDSACTVCQEGPFQRPPHLCRKCDR